MLLVAAIGVELVPGALDLPGIPVAWVAVFSVLTLIGLANRGMYSERGLRPQLLDRVRTIVSATAVATMVVTVARVVAVDDPHTAAQFALYWVLASTTLMIGRFVLSGVERKQIRAGGGRPTLIVGAGTVGNLVARRLLRNKDLGLRPVGFLDLEPLPLHGRGVPLPLLGASWNLEHVVANRGIEHVIFAFSTAPHDVVLSMVRKCERLGVTVSQVPRLFEATVDRVTVEHIGGLPIMTLQPTNPRGWQFVLKYASDRLIALALLLLMSPLLLAMALAVKLSTGGPVLFRQSRVGIDGVEFDMLKFRTMHGEPAKHGESDADWAAEILGTNRNGGQAVSNGGPSSNGGPPEDRRTRLGRFMRRYSLDELPQILNVARGEMSLIGPRPERASYARRFEHTVHRYGDRHRVKSGITGWAQVNGLRGKTSLADRVEWDNYYIENWSFWLDMKIAAVDPGRTAALVGGMSTDRGQTRADSASIGAGGVLAAAGAGSGG